MDTRLVERSKEFTQGGQLRLINSYNSNVIVVNKCGHTFIEMSHTLCMSCSKRFKHVKRFYCISTICRRGASNQN